MVTLRAFFPRVLALSQSIRVGKEQSCLCDLEVLLMETGGPPHETCDWWCLSLRGDFNSPNRCSGMENWFWFMHHPHQQPGRAVCAETPAQLAPGWGTVWVHWCQTGRGEPTGTAGGRLGITFILVHAASWKCRLTGMVLGGCAVGM